MVLINVLPGKIYRMNISKYVIIELRYNKIT